MLRTLLVLGILIPGVLLALKDRFKALLLYLWFAFFRPQEWVWFDLSSFRLSLVLGLLLLVPALLTGILPNLTHPLSIGAALFVLASLPAQTNALDPALGWTWIDFMTRLILVCLLAVTLIKTPRDLMRVIAVVALSLGFYGAKAGLASLLAGGLRFDAGLAGAFVDNNGYALSIVMTIPLLIVVAQNAKPTFEGLVPRMLIPILRVAIIVAVPLSVYTVFSTFSRGGFLGLGAVLLAFAFLHPRRVRLLVAMAIPLALIVALVPIPRGYVDRLETIGSASSINEGTVDTDPGEGRLHFWRTAISMATSHPLGVGLRNFDAAYDAYDSSDGAYGKGRAVHSSHFQVLAELGFFGAGVWCFEFGYAFVVVRRVRRRARMPGLADSAARFMFTVSTGLMVSMIGFLVGGSFIALALNDLTWLTFALVAALDRVSAGLCAEAALSVASKTVARPSRSGPSPFVRTSQRVPSHARTR